MSLEGFPNVNPSDNIGNCAGQSLSFPTPLLLLADLDLPRTDTQSVSPEVEPTSELIVYSPDHAYEDPVYGNLNWLNPQGIWSNRL